MSIKMIAVDMDGTFLDCDSKYDHERFHCIYDKLVERGIHFVVSSGNPYRQLSGNFKGYQDQLTFIAENGAYIIDRNKELYLESIDQDNVKRIIQRLKELPDVLCWVCTKNQSYTLNSLSQDYFDMFLPYFPGVKRIECFSMIEEPILKFALFLPDKNVEERIHDFMNVTDGNVHVVDSGHYCVDIIPSHVNKGEAIKRVMKYFNVSQDEVMAFGDAGNDEEMLRNVKYGYAMMNAKDSFKEQFDYIAPSNDDAGVFQVIEQYLDEGTFLNLK